MKLGLNIFTCLIFIGVISYAQEVHYSKVNIRPYEMDLNKKKGNIAKVTSVFTYDKLRGTSNDTISIVKYNSKMEEESSFKFSSNKRGNEIRNFYGKNFYGWERENEKAHVKLRGFKSGVISYKNKNGNLSQIKDYSLNEKGDTIEVESNFLTYDKKGNLLISKNARLLISYVYDKDGYLEKRIFATINSEGEMPYPETTLFGYDVSGKLISETSVNFRDEVSSVISFEYNENDLLSHEVIDSKHTNEKKEYFYTYDEKGRISEMKIMEGDAEWTVNYLYDALGNLSEKRTDTNSIKSQMRIPILLNLHGTSYKPPIEYLEKLAYDNQQNLVSKEIFLNGISMSFTEFLIEYR